MEWEGAGVDASCLTHVGSLPPGVGPSANPAAHLVSHGGNGPEVQCLPFGAPEPAYTLASQAPPAEAKEGPPGGLGPIGARPPPAPWQGTPAPLWEDKLLFISHPRQRAHDAWSLACVLCGVLLTTPGLQDLPALRERSPGLPFCFSR